MTDEKDVDGKPADGEVADVNGAPPAKPEDQKPADSKPADQKDSDTKEPQGTAPVVTEKYDLKLPEGSLLKPEHIDSVSEFSKENKLTQEMAQKVLERENTVITAYVEEQKKMVEDLSVKWVEEVKADKDLGGNNFAKTAELSKRVIDKFGPELVKELELTGLGNHPAFVRFTNRIGQAMSSGEFVKGEQKPPEIKSAAEVLYGGTSKKEE